MKQEHWGMFRLTLLIGFVVLAAPAAHGDVVTEWNARASELLSAAKVGTPPANRALAITQTAVFEAVNRITGRYALEGDREASASVDAAVAAANRASLTALFPAHRDAIEAAYREAISAIADGAEKSAGIAIGEQAAASVLERRAEDGAAMRESYRPHTTPGKYVPTTLPVLSQWAKRKPWILESASQFRPGPPPALDSALWARDYNEVKAMGAKDGSTRTAEQTDVARFWEATFPSIYYGVVRSVADQPGREVTRNARLFATVTQAMDDALIAVFDAKYHYNFWRPATAIRNGDTDGNDATERDASWSPFIETPMHPEYPCAHCILSATVGTILEADVGDGEMPLLSTTSHMVEGSKRSWKTVEDFTREVADGRVCDGVHFRNSTEVGAAMGRQIGALAAKKLFGTS